MIQKIRVDEISLNFRELFIVGKYEKIRSKNRGSPHCFLSSRAQKIKNIIKIEKKEIIFVCILGFTFYDVSHAKTDLHNKYMFNVVLGPYFEEDHLLNSIILGVYAKR